METWYKITAKANNAAEILLYGPIAQSNPWQDGETVTAKQFLLDLQAVKAATLDVHINSPGGDVFAGIAIYNALRSWPGVVNIHIDGLAASIASFIAMSGRAIFMPANALLMIHNPSTVVWGDANQMRKTADLLDKTRDSLLMAYRDKSGQSDEQLIQWLDAETWFNGAEALAAGLATAVTEPVTLNAHFDLSNFKNPPPVSAVFTSRRNIAMDLQTDQPAAVPPVTASAAPDISAQLGELQAKLADANKLAAKWEQDFNALQAAVKAEETRFDDIKALFTVLDEKDYAGLFAACLADKACTRDAAVNRIKAYRASLSETKPSAFSGDGTAAPATGNTFEAKVDELLKAGKTRAEAIRAIAADFPKLHADFVARANTDKD